MGKESGLFVASGTMGNLCGVGSWCNRGDEVILGRESHIFHYEGGGASFALGVVMNTIQNNLDGTLPLDVSENGDELSFFIIIFCH